MRKGAKRKCNSRQRPAAFGWGLFDRRNEEFFGSSAILMQSRQNNTYPKCLKLWERWHLPPSHSQSLLPNPDVLILDRIERDADRFRLIIHVEQDPVCPLCGEVSRSRPSCYSRCLQDLPWQGVSVQLWATVGRFRCRNSSCPRKIFCERLPSVARVYGRQTERASEIVRLIGYVAGGLPGQRLLDRLCIATSDDTILRRVRHKSVPEVAVQSVRNVGVDDWAWRKGARLWNDSRQSRRAPCCGPFS
jgi:hypothetical protein